MTKKITELYVDNPVINLDGTELVEVVDTDGLSGAALVSEVAEYVNTVDNTGFMAITANNMQDAFEEVDLLTLNARNTGVRFGGAITVNGSNPDRVDITAGAGEIIDTTNHAAPVYHAVTWGAQTNVAITNTGTPYTYWYVDDAGTITQTTTAPTNANQRGRIYLARTVYISGAIAGIASYALPIVNSCQSLRELAEIIGVMKTGFTLSANGANLAFNRASGVFFDIGANFYTAPTDPNSISITASTAQAFFHSTVNGQTGSSRTTLDVANYDNAGTVTAIGGGTGQSSIFTVWLFPTGNIRVQYGNTTYSTLTEAVNAISTRSFTPTTGYSDTGIILGWICATRTATALNNATHAQFVQSNKFGTFAGGLATQGIIDLATGVSGILPMANGGTGATLVDPNADRILFWDDSAGAMTWLTLGTNLSITGTTLDAASSSPTGSILQTLQNVKSDTATMSSTTFAATGLSQAITPASTSNKVLIRASLSCACGTSTQGFLKLQRNGTDINIGNTAGSRTRVTTTFLPQNSGTMSSVSIEFLDSPASVSAQTYTVAWASSVGGQSIYLNQSTTDSDNAGYPRGSSTLTVQEIKG